MKNYARDVIYARNSAHIMYTRNLKNLIRRGFTYHALKIGKIVPIVDYVLSCVRIKQ